MYVKKKKLLEVNTSEQILTLNGNVDFWCVKMIKIDFEDIYHVNKKWYLKNVFYYCKNIFTVFLLYFWLNKCSIDEHKIL